MQNLNITATLTRRLLAFFYDVLLLLGVLFAVSACAVAINKGEAVTHPAYYLSLILTAFVFFGWFWTHGGQTLGMRTWKIKITSDHSNKVSWKQAAIRFISVLVVLIPTMVGLIWWFSDTTMRPAAVLAMLPVMFGLIWLLFDQQRLAWHDKLSKTRLISLKAKDKADKLIQTTDESESVSG